MQAKPHRAANRRPQARRFIDMRAFGRQTENIRRELHRGITLRPATGNAQTLNRLFRALFELLLALAQGVGQPFEDRPIDMCAGMHVTKADHRALGFHARLTNPRRPVRLQHQPHGAGRHRIDQGVEQLLWLQPLLLGLLHFAQAELVLEPADHPVATVDHHFAVVLIRYRRRIRRNQRDNFEITRTRHGDGRGGAIGQAHRGRIDHAGAEHFTGLVGTRSNQRHAFGNAGMPARLGADMAQGFAGFEQRRQLFRTHRQRLPFPVGRCRPAQAFEVERQVAHATTHRVDESPAQAMGEKTRKQQELVGRRPHLGLVLGNPVGFGLGTEIIHGGLRADQFEQPTPWSLDPALDLGLALIEPQDCRTQGLALGIDVDHGAALGGQ
ncbi:hypothetical protein D3C77_210500 [compost metagenome]